jgi:indole-3-glycerol phosphate synthase
MGFLEKIVAATRDSIAAPDYLSGMAPLPYGPHRSLRAAVTGAGDPGALLAEYKRRSPGATTPDLGQGSVAEFAARMAPAPIAAYSCLAGRPEFHGAPTDVADLAAHTDRPVLFKDFVIDPIQLEAASRAGASAVLLIARLETEGWLATPLRMLATAAHERGLEVLLEWHHRAELRRTEDVPADVYGVNVRDLDTLEIRRTVGEETIRAAGAFRPLLGLSGVEGPAEARRFWDAGVDGILVGSALARVTDPRTFLDGLRRPTSGAGR